MKSLKIQILGFVVLLFTLVGCKSEAFYDIEDVKITMDIVRCSAGFCEVEFSTDKDAYYLIGVTPTIEGVNPSDLQKQFMTLALDSAYSEYINWRYALLRNHDFIVADFSSHSLQYGSVDHYFQYLTPNTDYWIFAFIVDPSTNKPCGKLTYTTVRTKAESDIEVHFDYRVNGTWDYVYPHNSDEEICADIPWVGATIDSLYLRDLDVRVPGEFFTDTFVKIKSDHQARILFGIYAHNNDGLGDGTSSCCFEQGHTYYTAMASLDGPLKYYDIYRFRWEGPSTKLYLTHKKDNTGGAW